MADGTLCFDTTLDTSGVTSGLEGLSEKLLQAADSLPDLGGLISDSIAHLPDLSQTGSDLMASLAAGMNGEMGELIGGVQNICTVILSSIAQGLPATGLISTGAALLLGLGDGVTQGSGSVQERTAACCDMVISMFTQKLSPTQLAAAGIALMTGVLIGMNTGVTAALNQVEAHCNAIKAEFAHKLNGNTLFSAGVQMVAGFVRGIAGSIGSAAAAAARMAAAALSAAKAALDIHSPSRRFRDEVGAMIARGVAVGIEENSDEVKKAASAMLDTLNLQRDLGVLSEAEYYKKIQEYRDAHFSQSSKLWAEYTKKLLDYQQKGVKQQFQELKWFHDNGLMSEEVYYDRLTRLRDTYLESGSEDWNSYTSQILSYTQKLQQAAEKAIGEGKKKLAAYNSPILQLETKGQDGEKTTSLRVNDYQAANSMIDRYYEHLSALKARAGDDETALAIFQEARDMDLDEAIVWAEKLIALDDNAWQRLLTNRREYDQKSERYAKDLFGLEEQQRAAAALEATAKSSWEAVSRQFREQFGQLPSEGYQIGQLTAGSLVEGALGKISEMGAALSDAFWSAMGVTPAPAGAGAGVSSGDTYNFYASNATVAEQLAAARGQQTLNRMRGI